MFKRLFIVFFVLIFCFAAKGTVDLKSSNFAGPQNVSEPVQSANFASDNIFLLAVVENAYGDRKN